MTLMIKYPLTTVETKIVAWTGRAITVLGVATMALLGTIVLVSS